MTSSTKTPEEIRFQKLILAVFALDFALMIPMGIIVNLVGQNSALGITAQLVYCAIFALSLILLLIVPLAQIGLFTPSGFSNEYVGGPQSLRSMLAEKGIAISEKEAKHLQHSAALSGHTTLRTVSRTEDLSLILQPGGKWLIQD